MAHQEAQDATTVAILGSNTLGEQILARLLKEEGYDTRLLQAHPTGRIDVLLDGVDVLLLTLDLDDAVRRTFVEAMRSTSDASQRVAVLSLSVLLQVALLDELSINASWQSLFEGLVQEIEDSRRRGEVA